jgi:hypothetical protein
LFVVALLVSMLGATARGNECIRLHLYQSVELADTIVVARISDADKDEATVGRVLKGQPPCTITPCAPPATSGSRHHRHISSRRFWPCGGFIKFGAHFDF